MSIVIKLLLSSSIIVLSGYLGLIKSKKLVAREQILREMITFLNLVKIVIGKIVVDMINCNNNTMLEQSITRNVSDIEELTKYDKEIFISTLKNLGRSDLESQINIIDNSISIIENQIKEANEVKIKNSKLYKTVGVITGLMIVIVFI